MTRRAIVLIVIAVVAAVAVAVVSVVLLVGLGHSAPVVPKDDALINLDGVAAGADGGKQVDVNLGSDAAQRFKGTTGCDSRHFVGYYGGDPNTPLLVVYSGSQATIAYSTEVYRFDEGPMLQGGILTWHGDFGPTGTFGEISMQINCPSP
ncbi:MAG: hypothetical protein JOY80_09410 [Candidatus Dormibacteraeota bacterium]|nr:hypothetical protein [Candidatus Dormibacteraeota bacterium]